LNGVKVFDIQITHIVHITNFNWTIPKTKLLFQQLTLLVHLSNKDEKVIQRIAQKIQINSEKELNSKISTPHKYETLKSSQIRITLILSKVLNGKLTR